MSYSHGGYESDNVQLADYADNESEEDNGVLFEVEGDNDGEKEAKNTYFSEDMKYINDTRGHFQRIDPVPIKEYPLRSDAFEVLSKLHNSFSKTKGFGIPDVEEGGYFYFISKKYVEKLCAWLSEEDDAETTDSLEIDNSKLFDARTQKLKIKLVQALSHVVVEDIWLQIIEWFGGGLSVKLQCLNGKIRILQAKDLRVVYDKDMTTFRRFFFGGQVKVQYAKIEICKALEIDNVASVRMHDIYRGEAYNRIDQLTNLKKPLKDMQLIADNLIFIESAGEDEKFKIKYNKMGRSTPQIDSIGGAPSPVGVVGLDNLGNTCYMNSIMQCLSNIPLLKESFLSETFKPDINLDNVLGYKGKVAMAYFKIASCMWSGKGSVVKPAGFRKVITKAKPDFEGFEQHDSQEFLSQLLDAMHEDLNRIKTKPFTDKVEARGRPDREVADESLVAYKSRNDSLVADLFVGLYKSTVTCPISTCGNVSVTFDPYMIIPLPLQTGEVYYHVLQVLFVPKDAKASPRRVHIIVPKHGPIYLLKRILMEELGINKKNEQQLLSVRNYTPEELSKDAEKLAVEGFPDDHPEIAGKSDLLIFRSVFGKLTPIFYMSMDSLSRMTESTPLVAYETVLGSRFENFVNVPDSGWVRKLNGKRFVAQPKRKAPKAQGFEEVLEEEEQSLAEDNEMAEYARVTPGSASERQVGLVNCPFLRDDVWHGSYNFNESDQLLRLEINTVSEMDLAEYLNYKEEIIAIFGDMGHRDTVLTEDTFDQHQVFLVYAIADSRTRPLGYGFSSDKAQTGFEVMGVYIAPIERDVEEEKSPGKTSKSNRKRTGKSLFAFSARKGSKKESKKGNKEKKGSSRAEEKVLEPPAKLDNESMYKRAKNMPKGILEEECFHGFFVFRPTDNVKVFNKSPARGYSYMQDESIREPIVLTGNVEKSFRYSWGRFQVHQGFVKGEFNMFRYESANWELSPTKVSKGNKDILPVMNITKYAVADNRDNRIMVLISHRLSRNFVGVPEVILLPVEISEAEASSVIQARLKVYLEKELKQSGESQVIVDKQTGEKYDLVETVLGNLKIVRTDSEFRIPKSRKGAGYKRNSLAVGHFVDAEAETPLQVGSEYIVWLIAYWDDEYPLPLTRGDDLFIPKVSSQEKMTLSKALELFQQTDKLSKMNAWYCNQCKEHREAFKQLQLWSLPKVLVIQFKRFSQDEGRSTADKLEIPVDFPFEINLEDVTLSSKIEEVAGRTVNDDVARTDAALTPYDYELVAVSSHVGGGLGFGHYIACAKNEETGLWYEFDDSSVSEIGEKDFSRIVNPQAYVLFYVSKQALAERQLVLEERRAKARAEAENVAEAVVPAT